MNPERRPDLRVSDAERESTLERLRDAHAEGRLDADEFYGRLDAVYEARTYADLDALVGDLPAAGPTRFAARRPGSDPQVTPPTARVTRRPEAGSLSSMPAPLRVAWLTWATAVLINVIIWTAVSLGNGSLEYFWPIWVAGPWGAVLLGSTALWRINRGDGGRPHEIGPGT